MNFGNFCAVFEKGSKYFIFLMENVMTTFGLLFIDIGQLLTETFWSPWILKT